MASSRFIALAAGPLAFFLIFFLVDLDPDNRAVTLMTAVTAWVAIWWLSEAVHLAVTSFIPFILIPVLGITDIKTTAAQYMDQTLFLFIGGFLIAFAIERWGLHKRIALSILKRLGSTPTSLLAGVMITTFLISMWISNTATTMMLISAVLALIYQVEAEYTEQNYLAKALLIGLAYAASIGGMATLVGTPPNMIFYRAYYEAYPSATDMDFFSWFIVGFPTAALLLIVAYFILRFLFLRKLHHLQFNKEFFNREYRILGRMSYEEKAVATIFSITAILWFTRTDIDFGNFRLPGWDNLFSGNKANITDSTVAIFMAVLLFLIPSKTERGRALLIWKDAERLPYSIILLFGSGFALAKGFETSGLSNWLAEKLFFLQDTNPIMVVLGICVLVCVISEFASNVASIQLALPILVSIQKATGFHPLFLMVPATLAASLGFMLPVATAPNTIVFGSGRIKAADMRNAGSVLDIAGILIIATVSVFIGSLLWK